MNVSEEIQLFQQGLIGVDVDENCRLLSSLGKDHGTFGFPHSSE